MQYAAELKELQRTLDHDEKLKDFLFHKSNDRAFAADLAEEDRERDRREAEAKDLEHSKQYKEAFDKIKKVCLNFKVGSVSRLKPRDPGI